MMPEVAVIVLTWNQRDLTLDSLNFLLALDYPTDRLQVLVVDNGSSDGTAQLVREHHPAVTVLQTRENLGYAGGNNVGIRYALEGGAEYLCILNNDVTVAPDFLDHLLRACRSTDKVGVTCPMICEEARPDTIWALGMAIDWRAASGVRLHAGEPASALAGSRPFEVDVASGTAMLAKAEVFRKAGLFDEDFYLYYEEVDWGARVRQAGYEILAVPAAQVWHRVSATLSPASPVVDYYMLRNHLLFASRHTGGMRRLLILGGTVGRDLATIAAYTVKHRDGRRRPHRNARLLALRDAALGRWGRMGPDVTAVCCPDR